MTQLGAKHSFHVLRLPVTTLWHSKFSICRMEINHYSTRPNAIFIDDGGPEAYEFATNYIRFNAFDQEDYVRAWDQATQLWAKRQAKICETSPQERLRPPELRNVAPAYLAG